MAAVEYLQAEGRLGVSAPSDQRRAAHERIVLATESVNRTRQGTLVAVGIGATELEVGPHAVEERTQPVRPVQELAGQPADTGKPTGQLGVVEIRRPGQWRDQVRCRA